jgi:hypothetical protein
MAINRGARASSHPTPSHFMATPSPHMPTPTPPPTQAHTSTRIVRSFFDRSPPVLSLFIRSSDRSWFVCPFVRSFVQIIFFLLLCCRNSDRSSFVHTNYSPLLFTVTIHRYYSSIIRSPQISTTHPSCCPVHLRPARPIFQSYELR